MSLKAKHCCGSAGPISESTGPELTYLKCLLYGLWPLPSPLCLWGQDCWAPRKQAAGGKWIMGSKLVRRKLNWKVLFLVSSNGENSHGNSLSGRWDQESHYFSSTDAKHHWEWWNVGLEGCIDFTWTCTMAWWRRLGVSVDGELVYHARTPGSHFSFWSQISKLNEEGYRHWLFGCAIILSACWGFLCHWQGLGFHWKYLIIYIIISQGENY